MRKKISNLIEERVALETLVKDVEESAKRDKHIASVKSMIAFDRLEELRFNNVALDYNKYFERLKSYLPEDYFKRKQEGN